MKTILATAIVALVPTTAMAADGNMIDGYGSVAAGYNSVDQGDWYRNWGYFEGGEGSDYSNSGNSTTKVNGLDLEARVSAAVPLGGDFAAQVDGVFSRTGYKPNDCPSCTTAHLDQSTLAVHTFLRDPSKGLIGLIGQRTTQNWNGGGGTTTYYVGGEGQVFMGRVTFAGQATYGTVDRNNSWSQNGATVALQLRYFPKDNLVLALRGGHEAMNGKPGANSGYNCPDYCDTQKFSAWDVGAKAEYRLPNSRVSFSLDADYQALKYRSNYIDTTYYYSNSGNEATAFRAMFGVKLNFGASTLIERDRSGASLDPVRPMTSNQWGFEN